VCYLDNAFTVDWSSISDADLRYLRDYLQALVIYQPHWQKRLEKINEELYKRSA
jgi:hypothetical protein